MPPAKITLFLIIIVFFIIIVILFIIIVLTLIIMLLFELPGLSLFRLSFFCLYSFRFSFFCQFLPFQLSVVFPLLRSFRKDLRTFINFNDFSFSLLTAVEIRRVLFSAPRLLQLKELLTKFLAA